MYVLDDMCELLEDELKEIARKGDITPTELDRVYKSVDVIKDIKTIEAMENSRYSYNGSYDGSYDGMSNDYSNARHGRDGDGDGRYSERRGRDAMGRYVSRDGSYDNYSRHTEKEQLMKELQKVEEKINKMP